VEIQHVLGKSEDTVVEALAEVRHHHLVPAPELIEGVPRFSVNSNLRSLMLATLGGTERLREMNAAVVAVTGGDLIGKSSRAIEDYRRQAEVLLRSGHVAKAEATLLKANDVYPNNAQLYAALGHLYERWVPQRVMEAREAWLRAYELNNSDRRMYLAWARLEEQEGEWQRMRDVAAMGLSRVSSNDCEFLQQAGYATSRLAQALRSSFNSARAEKEFERSDDYLFRALRSVNSNPKDKYRYLVTRAYRGLIVNVAVQGKTAELCRRLRLWLEFDRTDAMALEEAHRQGNACPEVQNLLAESIH
jgi:tetratricopeptide (TPR) repeat protein